MAKPKTTTNTTEKKELIYKPTKVQKISETFSDLSKSMNMTTNELFIFYHEKYEEFKNSKNQELEDKIKLLEEQRIQDRKLTDALILQNQTLNSNFEKLIQILSVQNETFKDLKSQNLNLASSVQEQNKINKDLLEEMENTNKILNDAFRKFM